MIQDGLRDFVPRETPAPPSGRRVLYHQEPERAADRVTEMAVSARRAIQVFQSLASDLDQQVDWDTLTFRVDLDSMLESRVWRWEVWTVTP